MKEFLIVILLVTGFSLFERLLMIYNLKEQKLSVNMLFVRICLAIILFIWTIVLL